MTQPELKQFIRNSAQQPVRVCLDDGAAYTIAHPDFAFTANDSLILASGPGHELPEGMRFIISDIEHISRVEMLKRSRQSKSQH